MYVNVYIIIIKQSCIYMCVYLYACHWNMLLKSLPFAFSSWITWIVLLQKSSILLDGKSCFETGLHKVHPIQFYSQWKTILFSKLKVLLEWTPAYYGTMEIHHCYCTHVAYSFTTIPRNTGKRQRHTSTVYILLKLNLVSKIAQYL